MKTAMKRRQGFSKIELLIVIVVVGLLAAILIPAFTPDKYPGGKEYWCKTRQKQLGQAFLQYVQDNNDHFPPVAFNNVQKSLPPYTKPFGWADALQIYSRDTSLLQCPREDRDINSLKDGAQPNFTDYWFNSNLGNVDISKINSPMQTILLGDGNDGTDLTNARYSLNALPQAWLDTEGSPSRRHLHGEDGRVRGGVYLFTDGHAQWIEHTKISNQSTRFSTSTFSIR